jgi:hypothetical protein
MKTYVEMEVLLNAFLTWVLDRHGGQLHAPASLPRENSLLAPVGYEAGRNPEPVSTL